MIDPRRILSCISEIRGTISSPRYYSFLISTNVLNVLLKVRLRVFDDLSNKAADQAVELLRTVKFVREHLAVTEINDDCLLAVRVRVQLEGARERSAWCGAPGGST